MTKIAVPVKPHANGPVAPRVRQARINRAKIAQMIEDRDAQADLSIEPDLSGIPDWAYQFFGANLSTEDLADVTDPDDDSDDVDDYLSAENDFGTDNPAILTEAWAEDQHPEGFYGHYDDRSHLDDDFEDHSFDMSAPEPHAEDDGYDAVVVQMWSDIDREAEQDRLDHLAETTPIHQHGGHRGLRALMASRRNLSRPHHYFEVA